MTKFILCFFLTCSIAVKSQIDLEQFEKVNISGDTSFTIKDTLWFSVEEDLIKFILEPSNKQWQLIKLDSTNTVSSERFEHNQRIVSEADKLSGICFCNHCTQYDLYFKNSRLTYVIVPLEYELSISFKTFTAKDLQPKKWYEKKFKTGQEIPLEEIFFVAGTDKLIRSSYEELEMLYNVLVKHPNLKIEIQGHVNGPASKNKREFKELSQARANTVMNWLIQKGISEKRLTAQGYGNSKMIFPNAETDEEMAANRRVRILIRQI